MKLTRYCKCCAALVGLMVVAGVATGCGSDKRDSKVRHHETRVYREDGRPHYSMAPADRGRAERAIERNERERSGERRPQQPPVRHPVDQPPRPSRR
ncbi:MAG: hypothetical protein JXO22_15905 [Phycisphaerae bacterium]|nr:hypothetical protein [Phycisphaerae bacterium]